MRSVQQTTHFSLAGDYSVTPPFCPVGEELSQLMQVDWPFTAVFPFDIFTDFKYRLRVDVRLVESVSRDRRLGQRAESIYQTGNADHSGFRSPYRNDRQILGSVTLEYDQNHCSRAISSVLLLSHAAQSCR